jgi:hypothetical protein
MPTGPLAASRRVGFLLPVALDDAELGALPALNVGLEFLFRHSSELDAVSLIFRDSEDEVCKLD